MLTGILDRDGCAHEYLDSRGAVPRRRQCLPAVLQTDSARREADVQHDNGQHID